MTTFYLVRHGRTVFNVEQRFQGGLADSPLLEEGIEGAKKLGQFLKDESFDYVAVSSQKRARDTAHFILGEQMDLDGLKIEYFDDLREIGFGDKEGEVFATEEHEDYVHNLRYRPDLYDPTPFSGETFDDLLARSTQVIRQLHKQYPVGKVLVVSHGVTLITLINTLSGKTLREARENGPLNNTSLSIMEMNPNENVPQFQSIVFNDTHFLQ